MVASAPGLRGSGSLLLWPFLAGTCAARTHHLALPLATCWPRLLCIIQLQQAVHCHCAPCWLPHLRRHLLHSLVVWRLRWHLQ